MTMTYSAHDKIAVITHADNIIGRATALKLAYQGCHLILILDQSEKDNHSFLTELSEYPVDILTFQYHNTATSLKELNMQIMAQFGRVDYIINNPSTGSLLNTSKISAQTFEDLIHNNLSFHFLLVQSLLVLLKETHNGHIVNIAPPLTMDAAFFHKHQAFSTSLYGLSLQTLGWSHEFFPFNIAVNSLWPRIMILEQFTNVLPRNLTMLNFHKPTIMADAIYALICKPAPAASGTFMIDDLVLEAEGIKNFKQYREESTDFLALNLFVASNIEPFPDMVPIKRIDIAPSF